MVAKVDEVKSTIKFQMKKVKSTNNQLFVVGNLMMYLGGLVYFYSVKYEMYAQ